MPQWSSTPVHNLFHLPGPHWVVLFHLFASLRCCSLRQHEHTCSHLCCVQLLPGGCLGTHTTWKYRSACFCNCLSQWFHVATRTCTLETTVCQNYYVTVFTPVHMPAILDHTCLHPDVSQHLHMVAQPCLFAYLLWYSPASDTMDSPGHTLAMLHVCSVATPVHTHAPS